MSKSTGVSEYIFPHSTVVIYDSWKNNWYTYAYMSYIYVRCICIYNI